MLAKVAVIGLGLIGGSLAVAMRQSGKVEKVCGYDRAKAIGQVAADRELATVTASLTEAVEGADLIVLAVPLPDLAELAQSVAACCSAHSIITDTASAKSGVVADLEHIFGSRYVGGHPMAGSEYSGPYAAQGDLFQGAPYVLTPTDRTAPNACEMVESMITWVGAQALYLTPEQHDKQVAMISHLPHLLAAALTLTTKEQPDAYRLAAGGWRDTTRVASGHEQLYAPILHHNCTALLAALDLFGEQLQELRSCLQQGVDPLRLRLGLARSYRQTVLQERGWS